LTVTCRCNVLQIRSFLKASQRTLDTPSNQLCVVAEATVNQLPSSEGRL